MSTRWQVWGHRGRRDRWTLKLVASYPFRWMAVIKSHFFVARWGWGEAGVCKEGDYEAADMSE